MPTRADRLFMARPSNGTFRVSVPFYSEQGEGFMRDWHAGLTLVL